MDIMGWGYRQGLKGIRKQIEKVIKKGRLAFLDDNKVSYTEKDGKQSEYDYSQFAEIAVDVGGWDNQMSTLGITRQDIVNILQEEYAKSKKGDI